jgi:APA family basic amino acid/polyamine antiporter
MVNYEKKLEYNDLLFISLGHIIGAGVFFLIGYVHEKSKEKTWMSILIGGLFMTLISNMYSKIPNIYNDNDNLEQKLISQSFNSNISNIILLIAIIGITIGAYIVSQSFGEYFSDLFDVSKEISVLFIIGLSFLLNINKIDTLSNFNNVITLIGLGIIILLILIGFYKIIMDKENINFKKYYSFNDYTDFRQNIWNILKGAYLILFAYFGFEVLVKLNKESINPKMDIPKSINHSMIIIIIIYTLLGFIYSYAINLKNKYNKKLEKKIPITNSLELLSGTNKYNKIITIAACIFTANTVLLSMLGASRLLDNVINIDNNINIPKKSIAIITVSILILYYLKFSIEKSIYISNTFQLLLFISVLYSIKNINHMK